MRFLLAALLCCIPLAAHADTYGYFALNATFQDGATINGVVVMNLDTTPTFAQTYQEASLLYTLNGVSTFIGENNQGMGWDPVGSETQFNFSWLDGTEFLLDLPTTSGGTLAGFSGGLCTGGCSAGYNSAIVYTVYDPPPTTLDFNYVTSGTFVEEGLAYTPEPASLMLLGTAGLGLFWRRSRA